MFYLGKQFTFDAGHRLLSHPELCRYPHGHTYRLEVVLAARELDANAMVCDYKALSRLVRDVLAAYDHAMILARQDPLCAVLRERGERLVVLEEEPTAEVLVRHLFLQLQQALTRAAAHTDQLAPYGFRQGVELVAVRLWETPTSWAEYRPAHER